MPATTVASVADRLDRGAEEVEPLLVGQVRALARRPGDDDAVRAVVDEVAGEALKRVEVDRLVLPERGHDRGEDVAEHRLEDTRAMARFVLVHGAWHGSARSHDYLRRPKIRSR